MSEQMPDLGYYFHPAGDHDCACHPQLDVVMHPLPTYRHFDPEYMQVPVVENNSLRLLRIHHPWMMGNAFRVCPGRVVLHVRLGKMVEAFTFGGELAIVSDEAQTRCTLTSPAPIFDLAAPQTLPALFTAEVEVLLARRRAAWASREPFAFQHQLANVDPQMLYLSCLAALQQKFAHFPALPEPDYHELAHFVALQVQTWQASGQWPALVPTLAELL